jgi:hypothetical protein
MESKSHSPGARLLGFAWAALMLLAGGSVPLAAEMAGKFSGGPVVLRDWIVLYGTVIAAAHVTVLLAVLAGVWRSRWLPAAARGTALVALGAACLALAGLLAFPHVEGTGPFAPSDPALQGLRALVFAPSLLADVALVALLAGLAWATPRAFSWAGVGALLALLDLVLAARTTLGTPLAVVACFHPHVTTPWLLAPWIGASVALVWSLRRA